MSLFNSKKNSQRKEKTKGPSVKKDCYVHDIVKDSSDKESFLVYNSDSNNTKSNVFTKLKNKMDLDVAILNDPNVSNDIKELRRKGCSDEEISKRISGCPI